MVISVCDELNYKYKGPNKNNIITILSSDKRVEYKIIPPGASLKVNSSKKNININNKYVTSKYLKSHNTEKLTKPIEDKITAILIDFSNIFKL